MIGHAHRDFVPAGQRVAVSFAGVVAVPRADAAPLRGLLVAVPLSLAIWAGIIALVF